MSKSQFSKADFKAAWSIIRAHRAEESKRGRIAYPDCYYDPAGGAASLCLSRRDSASSVMQSRHLEIPEGRKFYREIHIFFGGKHA